MRRVAIMPFVLWFADEAIGVGSQGSDYFYFFRREFKETVKPAHRRAEKQGLADFLHRRNHVFGFVVVHAITLFGILREPLLADFHQCAEANGHYIRRVNRLEQLAPVLAQEIVDIGAGLDSGDKVSFFLDAYQPSTIIPSIVCASRSS